VMVILESGSAATARNDVECETNVIPGIDVPKSVAETDERAHQVQIDSTIHAPQPDDGKVEVDTRQAPKYHSGKQTHR
ncbi:MAG: hypothetical protein ABI854_02335, partial [Betaproteobacteria bacterium]